MDCLNQLLGTMITVQNEEGGVDRCEESRHGKRIEVSLVGRYVKQHACSRVVVQVAVIVSNILGRTIS